MAEYIFQGSRYAYRDEDNVLQVLRRGDKVELSREQAQRHNAGKPGSAFVTKDQAQEQEAETVTVHVANEATTEAEDGSLPVSAAGTRNRKVAAPVSSTAEREASRTEKSPRNPGAKPATPATSTNKPGATQTPSADSGAATASPEKK